MSQPKMKFFQEAKKASLKSQSVPQMGAALVKNNKLLSWGYNEMKKTHPKATSPFRTLHAEVDAILGIPLKDLPGCDVYVYREFKNGKAALAKPCPSCYHTLRKYGIRRVFYTTSSGWEVIEF